MALLSMELWWVGLIVLLVTSVFHATYLVIVHSCCDLNMHLWGSWSVHYTLFFSFLLPVCECEAQTLQDPVALDVSVAIQQQAVLTCTVQYTGTVPPNITIMKAVGTLSSTT